MEEIFVSVTIIISSSGACETYSLADPVVQRSTCCISCWPGKTVIPDRRWTAVVQCHIFRGWLKVHDLVGPSRFCFICQDLMGLCVSVRRSMARSPDLAQSPILWDLPERTGAAWQCNKLMCKSSSFFSKLFWHFASNIFFLEDFNL